MLCWSSSLRFDGEGLARRMLRYLNVSMKTLRRRIRLDRLNRLRPDLELACGNRPVGLEQRSWLRAADMNPQIGRRGSIPLSRKSDQEFELNPWPG